MNIFSHIRVKASAWNRSVAPMQQARLFAGVNAEVKNTAMGQTISLGGSSKWRHPWHTMLHYSAPLKQWVATVEPGYVNGRVPVYQTTEREAKKTPGYGINPLSGEEFFSAWVFSQDAGTVTSRRVDIPLYARPAIKLLWRKIGFDGTTGIPEFFRLRGVQEPPPSLEQQLLGGSVNLSDFKPKRGMRLLRACDIILHQPRTALTSNVTIEPGIVTGISNVTQTLSLRSKAPGDRLKIFATSKHDPADPLQSGINPVAGDYEEATWDELLVSTVYLLSPPHTAPDSEPDSRWTPFVRHNLFWNLNYAQPRLRVLNSDPGLPYIPPLAGGAAQLIINFMTASINDATQMMLNILSAHSMGGKFWTATGGGSSMEFPEEEATQPRGKSGLDKDGRLVALRRAKAKANRMMRLDPEFPYRAEPFSTDLLT